MLLETRSGSEAGAQTVNQPLPHRGLEIGAKEANPVP
jgi:hypothetical protein